MTYRPAAKGDAVVDLDALVTLAARRGSGLRTRRAGVGVRVTARAARWAAEAVCHPPVISVVDMIAHHVRRRSARTDFVADPRVPGRTVCLVWRTGGGRDLALLIAFEDELTAPVPGSIGVEQR